MRDWSISAFFPQVKPAHLAQRSCTVHACKMTTAALRGLEKLLSSEELHGKHISIVKLSIVAAGKDTAPKQGHLRSIGADE